MPKVSSEFPKADAGFKHLLVDSISSLRPYSRKLAGNRHAAEDLVQDTILRALDKHHQWERGTNLEAWLCTIMRNRHFETIRKKRPLNASDLPDDTRLVIAAEPDQQVKVELEETSHAIDRLDKDFRDVLEMVAIDGVSYEDAAETLHLPVGTVRSRLSRARASLRQTLRSSRRYGNRHMYGRESSRP